jgi:hypothetical protein
VSSSAAPTRPSTAAWALGGAGLLPFVGAAVWLALAPAGAGDGPARALAAYAATIVSFLGGIHWGLAFATPGGPATARLAWGVVPSLIAWPALLLPPATGLSLLAAALVLCFAVDRRSYPPLGLGAWLPLRGLLTAVATLSCAAGAALA